MLRDQIRVSAPRRPRLGCAQAQSDPRASYESSAPADERSESDEKTRREIRVGREDQALSESDEKTRRTGKAQ